MCACKCVRECTVRRERANGRGSVEGGRAWMREEKRTLWKRDAGMCLNDAEEEDAVEAGAQGALRGQGQGQVAMARESAFAPSRLPHPSGGLFSHWLDWLE